MAVDAFDGPLFIIFAVFIMGALLGLTSGILITLWMTFGSQRKDEPIVPTSESGTAMFPFKWRTPTVIERVPEYRDRIVERIVPEYRDRIVEKVIPVAPQNIAIGMTDFAYAYHDPHSKECTHIEDFHTKGKVTKGYTPCKICSKTKRS